MPDPFADLDIRPASRDDAEPAAALLRDSICTLCHADHGGLPDIIARWTANKTPGQVRRWAARGPLDLILALRGGRILGVGATVGHDEVALNYVAPEARFSGVSRALLAAMEARIAAAGVAQARLTSTLTARAFYLARGWRDLEQPVSEFGLTGFPMVKDLGPDHSPDTNIPRGVRGV